VQGSLMTRLQTPDALNVSKPTMTARANRRTALILAFASRGHGGSGTRSGMPAPSGSIRSTVACWHAETWAQLTGPRATQPQIAAPVGAALEVRID
jgi:hypothetical protein